MNLQGLYYSFPELYEVPYLIPPYLIWRHRAIEAILKEVVSWQEIRGRILEIGCGSGFLSEKIAKLLEKREIHAIDSSERMIAYCSRRRSLENLRFRRLDFFWVVKNELGNEKFEAIVSLNAWPFFELRPSLEAVRRISNVGTRFVAVTYAKAMWSRIHSRMLAAILGRPVYLHDPDEFVFLMERFGFKTEYCWIDSVEGSYLVRGRAIE